MKIRFPKIDPDALVCKLEEKLANRKLGEIVNFEAEDDNLNITINKLGKSVLKFKKEDSPKDTCYSLDSEKIAFAHRAFKDEVTKKIMALVEDIGGTVES